MKRRTGWMAGLAAVALLLAATATAFGYQGQVKGSVTVAVRGTVTCGAALTLTATFVDGHGKPVSGQSVDWSFVTSASASDAINPTPTTTNSHGVATTTLNLGPVSGTRKVQATAGTVGATAVLNPSCSGAVLPITSTLPAESAPGQTTPAAALLLIALIFGVSGALTMRRFASTNS